MNQSLFLRVLSGKTRVSRTGHVPESDQSMHSVCSGGARMASEPVSKARSPASFAWLSAALLSAALLFTTLFVENSALASPNDTDSNSVERLRDRAVRQSQNIDPADYSISLDENCSYVISSSDREIRRIVYFDVDGNKHVAKRDHYGNRLGTDVNLADTSLAGVVEPGGTLFIKLRRHSRRSNRRSLVVELTNIPVCTPTTSCPAVIADDPVFSGFSADPDSYNVGVNEDSTSQRTCTVARIDDPSTGVFLFDSLLDTNQNGVEIFLNGDSVSLVTVTDDEFQACAAILSCGFSSDSE